MSDGSGSGSSETSGSGNTGTAANTSSASSITDTGSGDIKSKGPYLLLAVPDYDPFQTDGVTEHLTSYIRLGSANSEWQNEAGADLAKIAYLAGPAGKAEDEEIKKLFTTEELEPGKKNPYYDADLAARAKPQSDANPKGEDLKFYTLFIDDKRERGKGSKRPAGSEGHGMTPDERLAVSSKLNPRVGWRDHTDGNRITTTRGDKIEIIQGNYKLIVMGRQSSVGQAMGWEATGNNVQDFAGATMPGASVTVDWIPEAYDPGQENLGGVWLLQNSTENVWQYSRNAGNFKTEQWGDLLETYTGSENPERIGKNEKDGTDGHPTTHTPVSGVPDTKVPMPTTSSVNLPRGNPHIINKTWATRIEDYTGSSKLRVPRIDEKTYADEINSETHAGTVNEETHVDVTNSKTYAGAMTEVVAAGAIASTTSAGVIVEETVALNHTELFIGTHISIEMGALLDIFLGAKVEVDLSATYAVTLGPHEEFKTKKQKTALEDLKLSLSSTGATLRSQSASVDSKMMALNSSIRALVVALGI